MTSLELAHLKALAEAFPDSKSPVTLRLLKELEPYIDINNWTEWTVDGLDGPCKVWACSHFPWKEQNDD